MSQSTIVVAEATTEAPAAGEAPASGEAGHTTEGTAAEGGHGGLPPLDAHTFPPQILWLVIFFALLYLLMSKVALPKMAAVLDKRHKAIEGDLAKASALKHETEAAIQHYEKSLADARANAQGIATETRSKIADEIETERSALEKTLSSKLAEADSRISATQAKAMQDVHEVAAETAAEIGSELTGHKVSKEHAAKAIAGLKG